MGGEDSTELVVDICCYWTNAGAGGAVCLDACFSGTETRVGQNVPGAVVRIA